MSDAAPALLNRANSRAVVSNVGRMSDEQLIALRTLFQTIDGNNNGSITPSLLTAFYQDEGVTIDIRGVEDLFDTVGAEHSLPFRRFLVFAPGFVAKLPLESKWRGQGLSGTSEATSSASDPAKSALQGTHQALNRQIVDAQSRLDRILEEIASGESMLAAIHLKIHAAEQSLEQLESQVYAKETQLDAYNLVQPIRAKTPASIAATSSVNTEATETAGNKTQTTEENDDSGSDSESDSDAAPLASPTSDTHDKPELVPEVSVTVTSPLETAENVKIDDSSSEAVHDVPETSPESPKSVDSALESSEVAEVAAKPDVEVQKPDVVELDSSEEPASPEAKPEPETVTTEVVPVVTEPIVSLDDVEKPTRGNDPEPDTESTASTSLADTSEDGAAVDATVDGVTPKKRRKHRETSTAQLLENASSTDSLPTGTPKDKKDKKGRSKDKREKSSKRDKDKEKEKTREKSKEKRRKSTSVSAGSDHTVVKTPSSRALNDSVEVQLEDAPLNQSALGLDPLRTAQSGANSSPVRSPIGVRGPSSPRGGIVFPSNVPETDLPGEKLALIDKTFFASIDVKLQAIIDGLQPHQHILDLSYFNLVVYIQGLNASLTNVATKLPNASTVPQHLLVPQTTKKPSVVQLQPRVSSKASVIGMASVQISPSSPTPPTTTTVRTPLLGHLVSGPYFAMATGDMINSLGDTLVQCLNNLLISIQDSRSKTSSLLASLCSSWKAQLYRAICTAYHSMCNLITGITSDLAQYFFPGTAAPVDDPTFDRGLNSAFNQISMPPTNVNDDYLPDATALEIVAQQQASDSQLISREEFVRSFSVYFGEGVMEKMLYILDPWATHNIPIKRFAEFLRLFGTVVGASCFRQFQAVTETLGFQGYLTESVALALLEQQKPGTFCLWYNKVRPKFGVLNLSWFDDSKEIVSSTTITISSTHHTDATSDVPTFNFGFDYDGLSVSAPTLQELILTLCATLVDGAPLLTKPYTPQFARSSVFHGDMDSPEAEALLAKESDGTLLFRLSSRKGSLAVSYVFRGKVGHTLLKIGLPDCYEYSGQVYNSVEGVIQGHAQIFKFIFDSSTLTRTAHARPIVYL